jgi:hypothetical protein
MDPNVHFSHLSHDADQEFPERSSSNEFQSLHSQYEVSTQSAIMQPAGMILDCGCIIRLSWAANYSRPATKTLQLLSSSSCKSLLQKTGPRSAVSLARQD